MATPKAVFVSVGPDNLDVSKTLGASKLRTIFKIIIPAALPNIVS
ncbi:MAG: ABC transporter permease subunit, partial [Cyanobacteria bacterium J06627_28]